MNTTKRMFLESKLLRVENYVDNLNITVEALKEDQKRNRHHMISHRCNAIDHMVETIEQELKMINRML